MSQNKYTVIRKPSVAPTVTIHGSMAPAGKAKVPKRVKRTVCPSPTHDDRYQVGPDWKPGPGSFSALKPGQYLD